jgi:hypothetical protein
MINWMANKTDAALIRQIAKRAAAMAEEFNFEYTVRDAEMDITAAHLNGNPLRLSELSGARDGDFGHDVFGIRRFIDRTTGRLPDIFAPRYSGVTSEEVK